MSFKKIKNEKKANKEQENKTPELAAAKKALSKFFKDNNLDPTKDYSKDKKYGKEFKKLQEKLQKERDKLAAKYPTTDKKQMKKLEDKALAIANKQEKKKKEGKVTRTATKYDYPLVDGREMTKDEKKKYRAQQRSKANGSSKAEAKEDKQSPKKAGTSTKPSVKDKKRVKKEED